VSSLPVSRRTVHDRNNRGFATVLARSFDKDAAIVQKIRFVSKGGTWRLGHPMPLEGMELTLLPVEQNLQAYRFKTATAIENSMTSLLAMQEGRAHFSRACYSPARFALDGSRGRQRVI